jgi:hypothetical protein
VLVFQVRNQELVEGQFAGASLVQSLRQPLHVLAPIEATSASLTAAWRFCCRAGIFFESNIRKGRPTYASSA